VRDAFIEPVTWSPPVLTVTLVSLPLAAVTVMPLPGVTLPVPFAGEIETCRPAGAADVPPFAGVPLPPEHAEAARPAAQQIATAASRRYLRADAEDPATESLTADR
jgi:hypothetical protein